NGNQNAPKLVIGTFQAGNPNVVANRLELPLATSAATPGLWSLAARDTGLADGVYHYWYRVDNTHPSRPAGTTVLVTDPFATTVDWRVLSEIPAGFNAFDDPAGLRHPTGERDPIGSRSCRRGGRVFERSG